MDEGSLLEKAKPDWFGLMNKVFLGKSLRLLSVGLVLRTDT